MQVRGFVRDDGRFDVLVRHPVRTLLPSKLVRGCSKEELLEVVSQEAGLEEDVKQQLREVRATVVTP